MKQRAFALLAFLLMFPLVGGLSSCQSKSEASPKSGAQSAEPVTATINIPTAKCSTCAKHIKKAANGIDGVTAITVSTEKHTAQVKYIPTKTSLAAIETAIAKSCYTADNVQRDSAAYDALDECCK